MLQALKAADAAPCGPQCHQTGHLQAAWHTADSMARSSQRTIPELAYAAQAHIHLMPTKSPSGSSCKTTHTSHQPHRIPFETTYVPLTRASRTI